MSSGRRSAIGTLSFPRRRAGIARASIQRSRSAGSSASMPFAEHAGQRRRLAARRDRDRDTRAPDDSAEIRGRVGRIVHRVHEDPPALRLARDGGVDARRRRGDDQPRAVEIGGREGPLVHAHPRGPDRRVHHRRDDCDVGPGAAQRVELRRRRPGRRRPGPPGVRASLRKTGNRSMKKQKARKSRRLPGL